ncbi:hypothetical protein PQC53_31845 (plasmid) [Pseudomonas aeruginosa]|nr:hypothetical protein PQC53_31845 [Pseudomonas aeruginosa]
MTTYLALARLVEAGLKAEQGGEGSLADRMLDAVVGLADRLEDVEKGLSVLEVIADRTLFASVASYSYSRASALYGRSDEEFEELDKRARANGVEAYDRQNEMIQEKKSQIRGE